MQVVGIPVSSVREAGGDGQPGDRRESNSSTLAAEVSRMDAARAANAAGEYDEAVRLVERYHQEFPGVRWRRTPTWSRWRRWRRSATTPRSRAGLVPRAISDRSARGPGQIAGGALIHQPQVQPTPTAL